MGITKLYLILILIGIIVSTGNAQRFENIEVQDSILNPLNPNLSVITNLIQPELDCLNPMNYFNDFETKDIKGWTCIDANQDTNYWMFYTFANGFPFGGGNAGAYKANMNKADDWLFSPCFEMVSGMDYEISFDYASYDASEKLRFLYGKTTGTGLDQIIVDLGVFSNATYKESKNTISISEGGEYRFGWHCYSNANTGYSIIDNFKITEKGPTKVEESFINNLKFYPNPSNGIVNIRFEDYTTEITIYSSSGTLLSTQIINSSLDGYTPVNLTFLEKGLYFLKTSDSKFATLIIN